MSQVVMNELVNMSQEIIKLKDQKYALLEALKINLVLLEKVTPFKGQEELLGITVSMNREVIAKAEATK
jgi:hypothetical protein